MSGKFSRNVGLEEGNIFFVCVTASSILIPGIVSKKVSEDLSYLIIKLGILSIISKNIIANKQTKASFFLLNTRSSANNKLSNTRREKPEFELPR